MLTQEWMVTVKDVAGITGAGIKFDLYDVVLFLTSTYGSGAALASSTKSVQSSADHFCLSSRLIRYLALRQPPHCVIFALPLSRSLSGSKALA